MPWAGIARRHSRRNREAIRNGLALGALPFRFDHVKVRRLKFGASNCSRRSRRAICALMALYTRDNSTNGSTIFECSGLLSGTRSSYRVNSCRCSASAIAPARLVAPSLLFALLKWNWVVRSEICKRRAMSAPVNPCAASVRH